MVEIPNTLKTKIKEMVAEGKTLEEMATLLKVGYEDLVEFYLDLSAGDRKTFPIELYITKEWLEKELQTKTIARIAFETRTSHRLVKNRVKSYKIEIKQKLVDILTPSVIQSLFVDKSMTDDMIANQYNCSPVTIKKLRERYGITVQTRISARDQLTIELFYRLNVEYGFTYDQLAELFDYPLLNIKTMAKEYGASDHPYAAKIKSYKRYYAYQGIIKKLLEAVPHPVLIDLLKRKTLAEIAEEYEIIPPPENATETFSVKWLEQMLQRYTVKQISTIYLIGLDFLNNMIEENNLNPHPELISEEIIRTLYAENHWTDKEIATAFHLSIYQVASYREKYNLKPSTRVPIEKRLTLEQFKHYYIDCDLTLTQIALLYSVAKTKVMSLKRKYIKESEEVAEHRSLGVSDEYLEYLKKELKYKGFKRI